MIVAHTTDKSDRQVLDLHRSKEPVQFCKSLGEAVEVATQYETRFVLAGLESLSSLPPGEFATSLERMNARSTVIIRFTVNRITAVELYSLADIAVDVRDSLRGDDNLEERLSDARAGRPLTAAFMILRTIRATVPDDLRLFMAACSVLCRRVTSERDVASALGTTATAIGGVLRRARERGLAIPHFPRINAAILALHLLWDRERFGMRASTCARAAGFRDQRTCDNYLRYHFHRSQRQLVDAGGVCTLTRDVVRWFTINAHCDTQN